MRRENAPLTNIYADISRNLASKPFSKTCELDETTSQDLKDLADDIDGPQTIFKNRYNMC